MTRYLPPRLPGSVPSPPARTPAVRRRRLPRWLIGLVAVSALPGCAIAGAIFLIAIGQTELLAQIIVGCVLLVVFGTPALCLIAFFIGCFWLVARAGRSRRPEQRSQGARRSEPDQVIMGEVVFDD